MDTTTNNTHLILHEPGTILPAKRNADPARLVVARMEGIATRYVIHSVGRNFMLSQVRPLAPRS